MRALLDRAADERVKFGDGELPAPRSFSATVLARLTDVGAETQKLVAAAAVAGPRCPARVRRLGRGPRRIRSSALEEALAADLLVLTPGQLPEEIAFAHPLIRAAVYDDLSPTRRRALHLACAAHAVGPSAARPSRRGQPRPR